MTSPRALFLRGAPEALFGVEEVEGGPTTHTSAAMLVAPWMTGSDGRAQAGVLGVLADDLLGYAVIPDRPGGQWPVSIDLYLDVFGPLPPGGSRLVGRSHSAQHDERGGLALGEIRDEAGGLLAAGSQRLRFVPGQPAALDDARREPAAASRPHGASTVEAAIGLDPHLVAGGAEGWLDVAPHLLNPLGTLHGGISVTAAELIARAAWGSGPHPVRTASVHVTYLRPVPAGAQLLLRADLRHRGRTLAVVTVSGLDAAARLCTIATVTGQA